MLPIYAGKSIPTEKVRSRYGQDYEGSRLRDERRW